MNKMLYGPPGALVFAGLTCASVAAAGSAAVPTAAASGRIFARVPAQSRLVRRAASTSGCGRALSGRAGGGRAVDVKDLARAVVVDPHRSQPSAPHAAGVKTEQVLAIDQAERRPVA